MILRQDRDRIAILTLNRPEKRNALHPELIAQLLRTLDDIAADEVLQVVIITGAGSSFCAGLDLEHTLADEAGTSKANLAQVFDIFRKLYYLPQPVIAAINGPAIAGGFDLAQFCDIRLAAPTAVFGQTEINLGLTQMIYPLYKAIGISRARELAMTGDLISAEEAYRIGFVNHLYPAGELMSKALELADRLASKPRMALFETRRLSRDLIDLETSAAFERMGASIQERLQSEEHRQRLREFRQALSKK